MSISTKDLKLLWGRSGNLCAMCRIELSADSDRTTGTHLVGEQAHIVGKKTDGKKSPRSDSLLTEEERDQYHNLVLLCATDHTRIDKDFESYPIERLHKIKTDHELWVREQLAGTVDLAKEAANLVYASLIDATVRELMLGSWCAWSEMAGVYFPRWPEHLPDQTLSLAKRLDAAVWPGQLPRLEASLLHLSKVATDTTVLYSKNVEDSGRGYLQPIRRYKTIYPNPNYDKQRDEYEAWENGIREGFAKWCQAANWFADEVRNSVNPTFFAEAGRFTFMDTVYQLSESERETTTARIGHTLRPSAAV
ncbi:MAG: hypothetical protein REI94_03065 [Moraxellaceae bacterium]|nr:hypothetical protein [Moraxellaceae bacterium]